MDTAVRDADRWARKRCLFVKRVPGEVCRGPAPALCFRCRTGPPPAARAIGIVAEVLPRAARPGGAAAGAEARAELAVGTAKGTICAMRLGRVRRLGLGLRVVIAA